ncbi:hypothetical protein ACROYT_G013013 [Oculina patagonica]
MTGDKHKRRGKHKRGERGSVEEEEEENRKRLNMASEDDAVLSSEETNEVQEPSNLELKEMLVDIKIELTNIAREFAKEITELKTVDINISHTIKSKSAGTILVKFQSHKAKTRLYKARTKLKNLRFNDLFPDASTATRVAAGTRRIFINENLTGFRKELLRKANVKRKDGLIISAWSMDGKIFVKTSPEGTPIRIYKEEDLENL